MRTRDPKSWMWAEALAMLQDAERLQRQFFQVGPAQGARWEPPVDLFENGDELWILVALPGVPESHLEVAIENANLLIQGDRPLPRACAGATIHRLEIPYGRFERRIGLPRGRYRILQRLMDQGCLVIGLRRIGE